jgi:carbamoyl-phosphate synthase large subunit
MVKDELMIKVAVTGVGGGVGQSIMKALSIASLPVEVYAVDVQPLSAGLYRGVEGALLPRLEETGSAQKWEGWLQAKGVAALIPGSDHDLLPLAALRDDWEARRICQALVSDLSLVRTCRDKAVTIQRLEREGVPVPKSAWDLTLDEALSWARSNGYPVVVKPRDGSASRNLHIVQDEEEMRFYYARTPKPLLQEWLNLAGKAEEFTCAVFVDRDGAPIGTFMARRDLCAGTTYRAEVGFWPEIDELLLAIGRALRPRGPLNVQLRLTNRGPVPFELNIRCSGTASIRAYFGYNEPEMLLRHYVLGEALTAPKPRHGYALRYWNEVFLEDMNRDRLLVGPEGLKGKILAWP